MAKKKSNPDALHGSEGLLLYSLSKSHYDDFSVSAVAN